MSIYSNDNIRKIAKLTTRELPHLVQKRENKLRKNNGLYSMPFWNGLLIIMLVFNHRYLDSETIIFQTFVLLALYPFEHDYIRCPIFPYFLYMSLHNVEQCL